MTDKHTYIHTYIYLYVYKQVIEETHGFWKAFINGQADGGKLWKKA